MTYIPPGAMAQCLQISVAVTLQNRTTVNESQLYLIGMRVVKDRICFLNFMGISGAGYVIMLWAWAFEKIVCMKDMIV